jgi:hypothetical protein
MDIKKQVKYSTFSIVSYFLLYYVFLIFYSVRKDVFILELINGLLSVGLYFAAFYFNFSIVFSFDKKINFRGKIIIETTLSLVSLYVFIMEYTFHHLDSVLLINKKEIMCIISYLSVIISGILIRSFTYSSKPVIYFEIILLFINLIVSSAFLAITFFGLMVKFLP